MFETILVPLDGSDLAESALAQATAIQEKFGSKLIIVRSVESTAERLARSPGILDPAGGSVGNVEIIEQVTADEKEEAETYLAAAAKKLGGNIEALIVEGEPVDVIVEMAKEHKADLVIMSSHGRGGLGRLVFGSVADGVLRHCTVPVLLIRIHES